MRILRFNSAAMKLCLIIMALVIIVGIFLLAFLDDEPKQQTSSNPPRRRKNAEKSQLTEPESEKVDLAVREPVVSLYTGMPSDRWAPLIVETCQPGLSPVSAPCIQQKRNHSNLIKAQELIYPSFRLGVPIFLDEQHEKDWMDAVRDLDRMRVSNDKKWADYPTNYGQNLVFNNALYTGDPPADVWSESSCMVSFAVN